MCGYGIDVDAINGWINTRDGTVGTADWHKDDWPALNPHLGKPAHGYVDTYVIEKQWLEAFNYYYEHYDSFIFPMSIHTQVPGKGFVMKMHERIVKYLNSKEGVEWMTFEQMVDEFKQGELVVK